MKKLALALAFASFAASAFAAPETYVIDQQGVIRYKHIGPLTPEIAQKKLRPLVEELAKRG